MTRQIKHKRFMHSKRYKNIGSIYEAGEGFSKPPNEDISLAKFLHISVKELRKKRIQWVVTNFLLKTSYGNLLKFYELTTKEKEKLLEHIEKETAIIIDKFNYQEYKEHRDFTIRKFGKGIAVFFSKNQEEIYKYYDNSYKKELKNSFFDDLALASFSLRK